jgi:hypothetical protein
VLLCLGYARQQDTASRLAENFSCRGPHRVRHGTWVIEARIEIDIYTTDLKPDDRPERRSVVHHRSEEWV